MIGLLSDRMMARERPEQSTLPVISASRGSMERLRSLRIGVRLTCCFGVMVAIMLAGAAAAIWQMRFYNSQVERLNTINRRMISVLKVNSQVLAFRELIQTAAREDNTKDLQGVLIPFRAKFLLDVGEASAALREGPTNDQTVQRTIYTLLSYETAIPGQIDATLELASFNDWQAIHYRLEKQILQTSRVLTQIVGEIEKEANAERRLTLNTMAAIRYRVTGVLPLSCFLILLTAGGFFGARVTGSIAEPLRELELAAQELGSGVFSHRVAVSGKDELSTVAVAFNSAAERIEHLHSGLEVLVAQRTADLQKANESLRMLSAQDPLTGIANRRTLDFALQELLQQGGDRKPVSLLMIDIDHFKGLNDSYGHQRGDECLIQVVRAMQLIPLRGHDLIARYGGEEFAVVLAGTDTPGAKIVAEKVRAAIAELGIPNLGSPHLKKLSVSIGVGTAVPGTGIGMQQLIEDADQALYRAKQNGRNQVCA